MRIALGSDHAGYAIKRELARWLRDRGHDIDDVGTDRLASVDYPDFAFAVGERVASGRARLGILVCGSGIGMSIAANRIPGVRAAVCTDDYSAGLARGHNDANVLCVGARVTGPGQIESIVATFLDAEFEGGRHARRVDKITAREEPPDRT